MSPRPISGKKKNIQSTTINTANTKYKDGLSSRRCSVHWRIILKIKTVKWRGPLAGNEKEKKNASELPKNLFFFKKRKIYHNFGRNSCLSVWEGFFFFTCAVVAGAAG